MGSELVVDETYRALMLILYVSAPIMISVTLVGLLVGLFQALTSIQEQTLPQSFKFVTAIITIAIFAGWAGSQILQYNQNIFHLIPRL